MLSKRGILVGAASLAACFPRPSLAGLACQDFPGFRRCTVGVQLRLPTARQRCTQWCWAACIEAIFTFHGHPVRQERIVEKVFGDMRVCHPAVGPQIVYAVQGDWEDDRGRDFHASAEVLWDAQFAFGRPDAVLQAAQQLERDNPLILGALGHATVLSAMTYSGNAFGVQLNELVVRDPFPGNPNRRVFTLQEALATQFLTKVTVS